ncbi:arginine biosynthesis-like protein [Rhizoctonia solani AG-1 IA]|uniref:Arginine biosynthesis bifunctional protein ArgJ, mitochondrial n=1 Tax=Thanatephorus cucumeris (strain AG1-IA) TaxID=983506 RepID=L8X571_THACA|nr:arginine biosynthesis-like protein [Rhizoctonia solani AG-1 IA]
MTDVIGPKTRVPFEVYKPPLLRSAPLVVAPLAKLQPVPDHPDHIRPDKIRSFPFLQLSSPTSPVTAIIILRVSIDPQYPATRLFYTACRILHLEAFTQSRLALFSRALDKLKVLKKDRIPLWPFVHPTYNEARIPPNSPPRVYITRTTLSFLFPNTRNAPLSTVQNTPTPTHPRLSFPPGIHSLLDPCRREKESSGAACFTRNAFKAAPVQVSTEVLKNSEGRVRSLVVNSGCANAVTGAKGLKDAWAMAASTDALGRELTQSGGGYETLVMSTGVIGQHLPIEKITNALGGEGIKSNLGLSFGHWEGLARAFMTTDTFPKLRARKFSVRGKEVKIAGIDKGAGMIHPNMGPPGMPLFPYGRCMHLTATDAGVTPRSLQSALTYAVDRSFNSISVDGDMSTNDTVIAFANGAAFGDSTFLDHSHRILLTKKQTNLKSTKRPIRKSTSNSETSLPCSRPNSPHLSYGMERARPSLLPSRSSYEDAHKVASTISTSALVKCALYGEDANWGRILCAVGYTSLPSGTAIDPTRVSVSFVPDEGSPDRSPLQLLTNGEPEPANEERASEILKREDLEIRVQLGLGKESANYYTCDFSHVSFVLLLDRVGAILIGLVGIRDNQRRLP